MEPILTPSEYFNKVKSLKFQNKVEDLDRLYDSALALLESYKKTDQIKAMQRTLFTLECITREYPLLEMGIDTFVYRTDIDEYIDSVAKNVVKTQDLRSYLRPLPQEAVEAVEKTKHIFDEYYIVFTDYTGKVEKEVAKTRRDKDPILFGAFIKRGENNFRSQNMLCDRFYYLADWVDENCDLTFDKMIGEMSSVGKEIKRTSILPKDLQDLTSYVNSFSEDSFGRMTLKPTLAKRSFFGRIRSAFKR